jgi:hypothetical protein
VGSRFSNQVTQSALRSRRLMTRINASLAIDLEQATEPHSLASAFEIQNDQSTVTPEFASGSRPRHRFLRDIKKERSLSVLQHAKAPRSRSKRNQRGKIQRGKIQRGKIQRGKIQRGKIQRGKIQRGKTSARQNISEAKHQRGKTSARQNISNAKHQRSGPLDSFRKESAHTARAC